MNRLVILDRDGVINRDSDDFIRTVDEWQPLPGSIEAISRLSQLGFTVTVASNQSGIGRGYFSKETVYKMHRKMRSLVRAAGGHVSAIAFCPHAPDEGCRCRKPEPGLLEDIRLTTGMTLERAWLVGDSFRDLVAGQSVGCQLILVRSGKGRAVEEDSKQSKPDWWSSVTVCDDLMSAAELILESVQ
ncbi:MAG: D-glycero-beta-D-manno-heptose 1,7-bisphosphate 7-phosphatase [Woeseiaceae bacterium]